MNHEPTEMNNVIGPQTEPYPSLPPPRLYQEVLGIRCDVGAVPEEMESAVSSPSKPLLEQLVHTLNTFAGPRLSESGPSKDSPDVVDVSEYTTSNSFPGAHAQTRLFSDL